MYQRQADATVYHQCHGNTNAVQCVFKAHAGSGSLFAKVSIWMKKSNCHALIQQGLLCTYYASS